MGNMNYCRFENTLSDLQDCSDTLLESSIEKLEENANEYEKPCIRELLGLCKELYLKYKNEINN